MAAERLIAEQGMTRAQTVTALEALKDSQQQARELNLKTPTLDAAIKTLSARLETGNFKRVNDGVIKAQQATKSAIANAASIAKRERDANSSKADDAARKTAAVANAVKNARSINSRENSAQKAEIARAKQAAATAGRNTSTAARTAGTAVSAATDQGATRIVGAINGLDLTVNVTTVNRTSTVNNRYGPSGGSSGYQRVPGAG